LYTHIVWDRLIPDGSKGLAQHELECVHSDANKKLDNHYTIEEELPQPVALQNADKQKGNANLGACEGPGERGLTNKDEFFSLDSLVRREVVVMSTKAVADAYAGQGPICKGEDLELVFNTR
jgi:hypothetical protein